MNIFNWSDNDRYSSDTRKGYGGGMYTRPMRYVDFDIKNPHCLHCMISDRAYASIITEVINNGKNETGGVLLGYIFNRTWYVMESVDPGMETINQVAFFRWDSEYVNHQAERLSRIYQRPMTILGFWHRHPGSMDYFSDTDESTIQENLMNLKAGLLSMLVNIDPKLRMTFYYCYGRDIMKIRYDVGNQYFPVELLRYADAQELSNRAFRNGSFKDIHYEQVINLQSLAAKKKPSQSPNPAGNRPQNRVSSVQQATPPASSSNTAGAQSTASESSVAQITQSIRDMQTYLTGEMHKISVSINMLQEWANTLSDRMNALEQQFRQHISDLMAENQQETEEAATEPEAAAEVAAPEAAAAAEPEATPEAAAAAAEPEAAPDAAEAAATEPEAAPEAAEAAATEPEAAPEAAEAAATEPEAAPEAAEAAATEPEAAPDTAEADPKPASDTEDSHDLPENTTDNP